MPTHAEAVALFERRRQAWLGEDVEAYLALWADDLRFQSPVHREPLCGRAAFAALVRQSLAVARPVRFDFHHLAVAGPMVLAEWSIAVERRADSRPMAWDGMSVAEIHAGRIAWWREYWNPGDLV